MEWWGLLVPAIAALVGGIVGSVLSPLLTGRTAHKHWKRDKLAQASEKLSAKLLEVDDLLRGRFTGRKPTNTELQQCIHELNDIVGELSLYASKELSIVSNDVVVHFSMASMALVLPSPPEDPDVSYKRFSATAEQAINTLRRELGV